MKSEQASASVPKSRNLFRSYRLDANRTQRRIVGLARLVVDVIASHGVLGRKKGS